MATIAEIISASLASGLTHPGDASDGQKPFTIQLPLFRRAGIPPEMQREIDLMVKLMGEAIVHIIETAGASEIVAAAQMRELRDHTNCSPECPHREED